VAGGVTAPAGPAGKGTGKEGTGSDKRTLPPPPTSVSVAAECTGGWPAGPASPCVPANGRGVAPASGFLSEPVSAASAPVLLVHASGDAGSPADVRAPQSRAGPLSPPDGGGTGPGDGVGSGKGVARNAGPQTHASKTSVRAEATLCGSDVSPVDVTGAGVITNGVRRSLKRLGPPTPAGPVLVSLVDGGVRARAGADGIGEGETAA